MKQKTVFTCQQCGYQSPKWLGQCPECGNWNTLVEDVVQTSSKKEQKVISSVALESLSEVLESPKGQQQRLSTGIGEFNRVLGKSVDDEGKTSEGFVAGSVVLIAGEPGIGKSTLITQTVINILMNRQKDQKKEDGRSGGRSSEGVQIVYVNGEENSAQVAERVERIHKKYSIVSSKKSQVGGELSDWGGGLSFAPTTNVDEICSIMESKFPSLIIVDSIQTLTTEDLTGTAGSFGQLKESTQRITEYAKKHRIPAVLIGHVTKDGNIAGPKVLEHIVDAVLELSGERTGEVRLLRAIKNRFGATDEVGLFLIDEDGLKELTNPAELFLQDKTQQVPGSAIVCTVEGTRPLLLETQALVIDSQLAIPRRVAQGISSPRLQVLTAVLQKHGHIALGNCDVFVNVAGGFQIKEPAADLGIAMAMVSSAKNKRLPDKTVFIGEVGLLGEIREVSFLKRRIKESERLGFSQVISFQTHRHISQIIKDFFEK